MVQARVMGGTRCDPATAIPVAEADSRTLYRTKSGRFFLLNRNEIILITRDEAEAWLDAHAPDAKERAFDTEKTHVTLELPTRLIKQIDRARGSRSRSFIILQALEQYFTNIQRFSKNV